MEFKGMTLALPVDDTEMRPYLEAAGRGALALRSCDGCGLLRFPPGPGCPWCSCEDSHWEEVTGRGSIYSYEIVTHAVQPGFAQEVPYPVVLVELDVQRGIPSSDEGIRIIGNLVGADFRPETEDRVAINARVEAVFQPIGEGLALPQWRLSDDEPQQELWRLDLVASDQGG